MIKAYSSKIISSELLSTSDSVFPSFTNVCSVKVAIRMLTSSVFIGVLVDGRGALMPGIESFYCVGLKFCARLVSPSE